MFLLGFGSNAMCYHSLTVGFSADSSLMEPITLKLKGRTNSKAIPQNALLQKYGTFVQQNRLFCHKSNISKLDLLSKG